MGDCGALAEGVLPFELISAAEANALVPRAPGMREAQPAKERSAQNCPHDGSDRLRFADAGNGGYSTNVPRCFNSNRPWAGRNAA